MFSSMRLGSFLRRPNLPLPGALVMIVLAGCVYSDAQQVLQRGALGRPSAVLDDTGEWTSPLAVASDKEVEIYIPDVSNLPWVQRNYDPFWNKGQYTISLFTFYKTPRACRENQTQWGLGDAAHLDACAAIGYRVRTAMIDAQQKTVTLVNAAMIGEDGQLQPDSVQTQAITRGWAQLDPNSQAALQHTTELVQHVMNNYDRKLRSVHR